MCNNCIHKPVCSIYMATGGEIIRCRYRKEEGKGEGQRARKPITTNMQCSVCHKEHLLSDHNFCPNCGADMRGTEDV